MLSYLEHFSMNAQLKRSLEQLCMNVVVCWKKFSRKVDLSGVWVGVSLSNFFAPRRIQVANDDYHINGSELISDDQYTAAVTVCFQRPLEWDCQSTPTANKCVFEAFSVQIRVTSAPWTQPDLMCLNDFTTSPLPHSTNETFGG